MQDLMRNLLLGGGGGFSPQSLFTGGVEGALYDPSDLSTLYQDSAGTTPVTGVEQVVGLMLDKSKNLALGPNLAAVLPTPTILDSGGSVGVWDGSTQTISSTTITAITNYPRYQFAIAGVTAGKNYQISVTATGTNLIRISNPSLGGVVLTANFASGTLSFIANNVASNVFQLVTDSRAVYSATLTVSIRELPGNHATSTGSARPTLSARVNLLTYSEEFDNGAWGNGNTTVTANAAAAPDGTTTADLLFPASTGSFRDRFQQVTATSDVYVLSCFLKASGFRWAYFRNFAASNFAAHFDLQNGVLGTVQTGFTATITDAGNGWYRCTLTSATPIATPWAAIGMSDADNSNIATASGSNGILVWGADLRPANIGVNIPPYQRIAAATNYDTSGFPFYLSFGGAQSMSTPANLDLTSTDKVTVYAGVRKLSDAAIGLFAEFSNNAASNVGSFYFAAPVNTGASGNYSFYSRGSVGPGSGANSSALLAPRTSVVAGLGDISGDLMALRVDGAQVASSTSDQGTGNYGTYPLYIGARAGSSLFFNGYLYSLIIQGAAASATQLASTEAWVNQKTKAY